MALKMDMNNRKSVDSWLSSMDIWLQSLGLLFKSCAPLTYDCILTEAEQAALIKDISNHTYYCQSVQASIESETRPMTWDEWSLNLVVEESSVSGLTIDIREFGDTLTNIFNGLGARK